MIFNYFVNLFVYVNFLSCSLSSFKLVIFFNFLATALLAFLGAFPYAIWTEGFNETDDNDTHCNAAANYAKNCPHLTFIFHGFRFYVTLSLSCTACCCGFGFKECAVGDRTLVTHGFWPTQNNDDSYIWCNFSAKLAFIRSWRAIGASTCYAPRWDHG